VLILCMVALLEQHPLPRDEMEPRMHTD
jgi:hypothetical protein